MYEVEKKLLPEFPTTRHLPLEPNAARDDVVATEADMAALLACPVVYVEEKIDGSNCGMTLLGGQPIIRNRTHILNKAYTSTDTPAKKQFVAVWTWFYAHLDSFLALEKALGYMPSVYGEWLYARHATAYNALPDTFVAYDLYAPAQRRFLDTGVAREALVEAGFAVVPLIACGQFTPQALLDLRDGPSQYSTSDPREGIYLKGCDGESLTYRFKMVRPGYCADPRWTRTALVKNQVVKGSN